VIGGTVTVTGTISDTNALDWLIALDGNLLIDLHTAIARGNSSSDARTVNLSLDTTTLTNGRHSLILYATDKAGNTTPSTPVDVFIVNGRPTAKLALIGPGPVDVFDQFGNLTPSYSVDPGPTDNPNKLPPPQTLYLRGTNIPLAFMGTLTNNNSWTLTSVFNEGAVPPPSGPITEVPSKVTSLTRNLVSENFDLSKFTTQPVYPNIPGPKMLTFRPFQREGRYQISLLSSNPSESSLPALMDLVPDSSSPQVQVLSPLGSQYTVAPASLVSLVFKVSKPGKNPQASAPILRYSLPRNASPVVSALNAPRIAMKIYDAATHTLRFTGDLFNAVQFPDLTQTNGSASLSGDAFSGYVVNWQIRMTPNTFSVATLYVIELTDATDKKEGDVVGHPYLGLGQMNAGKPAAYFTININ
jgi:hypothetical protein